MTKLCGIYVIKHLTSGKVYVGQSRNILKRWKDHTRNGNSCIGKALRKYGKNQFSFGVLEQCNPDDLNDKEVFWIGKLMSTVNGYNILPGGGQFDMPEQVKIRIGDSQRKRYVKRTPNCFVTFSGGKQNASPLNVRPKRNGNGQIMFSDYQTRMIFDHMFKPTYLDNQIEPELWDIRGADKQTVLSALFYQQLT